MPPLPQGFDPIDATELVARALAQRGRGTYHLGGGAHWTAFDVYDRLANNYPGQCDCTGLLAYAAKYTRGPWNTDAIVDDAKVGGAHRRFRVVPHDEPIRPGDFIITGRGHNLPDHAGIVVDVLPGFVRGAPDWWRHVLIVHCSGELQHTIDPTTGHVYGATRVTDGHRWHRNGYFIRPHHVLPGSSTVQAPSGPAAYPEGVMPGRTDARAPVADPIVVTRSFGGAHQGTDLQVSGGLPVYAPESGTVWVAADSNAVPGFAGAGPAFVYMKGDSGMFHLLAELAAVVRTAGHVEHSPQSDGYLITLGTDYPVSMGDVVGIADGRGYVHWEMAPAPRTDAPAGRSDQRYLTAAARVDPMAWLSAMTATVDDESTTFTVRPNPRPKPSSGGLLWLVAGYFVGRELRWW